MCSTADALAQKPKKTFRHQQTYMNSPFIRSPAITDSESLEEKTAMMLETRDSSHGSHFESNCEGGPPIRQSNKGTEGNLSRQAYLRKLALQKEEEMIKEKEKLEDYASDWRKIAEIFDRLFFWFFLLAIFLSTLALFHPLITNQTIVLSEDELKESL